MLYAHGVLCTVHAQSVCVSTQKAVELRSCFFYRRAAVSFFKLAADFCSRLHRDEEE